MNYSKLRLSVKYLLSTFNKVLGHAAEFNGMFAMVKFGKEGLSFLHKFSIYFQHSYSH